MDVDVLRPNIPESSLVHTVVVRAHGAGERDVWTFRYLPRRHELVCVTCWPQSQVLGGDWVRSDRVVTGPCPKDVAAEALAQFIESLTVDPTRMGVD